jgi:hypothetical protein
MQKLWDERHSIRAPSAEHLGTQAVQLAEAAFLDFVISKQVVTNSSIQEGAILGRAAGPGKACSSDWAKASRINEQGKPACNGQTGHQEIQAPSVPRVDGDVCVAQHPLHVSLWHVAPGFLEHLSPGSDDTLMPGTVSPRSAAGSSVVAVWVNRSPAPFAVFPSAASGQTQPAPQSTKEFGIAQAECVGGGDGGQPSASVRPGARTQAGPPGKRALPRGASKSNEEGLVLSLFQHPAGTALPPASVFVGASLIPVLIGRQNAAAQQVPGRHGLKALIAQEPRGLIGPADQGARITWLSGLLVQ